MLNIHGLKLPMLANEIIAGDVRFVDSGGSNTLDDERYGKTPDKTFATIDYPIGKLTADNGDYIIILPGHAENIALTTTIDIDVAGLTFVGLGRGASRPTLTQTVVAMYVDVAAANTELRNILFMAGVNTGTGAMLNVIGDDCLINMCEFKNVSSSLHTNHFIEASGANTADGLIVTKCRFDTMAAADADTDSAISLAEVQDRVKIIDNVFVGSYDDACIHNVTGKTCTNLLIADNDLYQTQAGDHCIELVSACTGIIRNNRMQASSFGAMLDPGSCKCYDNWGTIAVDMEAVPIPGTGGGPRLATKAVADMSDGTFDVADHPTLFTITGTVMARCWAVVTTGITSASNTGTIELGTTDDLDAFIGTTTVGSGTLAAGDVWTNATVTGDSGPIMDDGAYVICDDTLIECDVNTKNMTAGAMTVYCQWIPISLGADCVAA